VTLSPRPALLFAPSSISLFSFLCFLFVLAWPEPVIRHCAAKHGSCALCSLTWLADASTFKAAAVRRVYKVAVACDLGAEIVVLELKV
jgi:hypothetical protein